MRDEDTQGQDAEN